MGSKITATKNEKQLFLNPMVLPFHSCKSVIQFIGPKFNDKFARIRQKKTIELNV